MLDEMEEKGTRLISYLMMREYKLHIVTMETPVEDFTQSFMINTIAPAIICYRLILK